MDVRRKVALAALGVVGAVVSVFAFTTSSREALLAVGAMPSALSGEADKGHRVSLAELRGAPVLVFFYPRDETPGCTKEACAFRDTWDAYEKAGVRIIGVSGGSVASKTEFASKHALPFPVIADEGLRWAKTFGVRVVMGIPSRTSFLLDAEGRVAKIYRNVDPGVHADEVLADASKLR